MFLNVYMSITAILIVTAMYTIIYKHVILFSNRRVAPKRECCMLRMWLVSCRALEQHRNWLIFQIVLPRVQRLRETERNLTADIDTRTIIDASNGPPLVLVLLVRRDPPDRRFESRQEHPERSRLKLCGPLRFANIGFLGDPEQDLRCDLLGGS